MEKIRMDYLKFWLMTFMISLILFSIAVILKINELSQAPIFILATFGIILYIYIVDEFTQSGYYVNTDGIYVNKKLTAWDQISIQKDSFIWKILLTDRNIKIHFDKFHQRSIINLVRKYCPKDHELYQLIEEYNRKNLRF